MPCSPCFCSALLVRHEDAAIQATESLQAAAGMTLQPLEHFATVALAGNHRRWRRLRLRKTRQTTARCQRWCRICGTVHQYPQQRPMKHAQCLNSAACTHNQTQTHAHITHPQAHLEKLLSREPSSRNSMHIRLCIASATSADDAHRTYTASSSPRPASLWPEPTFQTRRRLRRLRIAFRRLPVVGRILR